MSTTTPTLTDKKYISISKQLRDKIIEIGNYNKNAIKTKVKGGQGTNALSPVVAQNFPLKINYPFDGTFYLTIPFDMDTSDMKPAIKTIVRSDPNFKVLLCKMWAFYITENKNKVAEFIRDGYLEQVIYSSEGSRQKRKICVWEKYPPNVELKVAAYNLKSNKWVTVPFYFQVNIEPGIPTL